MKKSELNTCLEFPECNDQMQVDGVFKAEEERINDINNINSKCEEFINNNKTEENSLTSNKYLCYADKDLNGKIERIYFISKDSNIANKQLNDFVDTCAWLSDSIFLYSQPKSGIYYYNLDLNQKGILISGRDQFKIKSAINGIVKYDNTQVEVKF